MNDRELSKEFIHFLVNLKKYLRQNVAKEPSSSISEQQFRTLLTLNKHKKINLKSLSDIIHVSNSSLCIMLNKMVEEELATREADNKDRRNTFYKLTTKGESFLRAEMDKRLDAVEDKITKLSPEKKDKLYEYLKGLEDIIEEMK